MAYVLVMVYLAVFYLDINMIVPNVLVCIMFAMQKNHWRYEKKTEYVYPSKPVYDLKKFIYIFSYIIFFSFKFNSSMELTTKTLNIFFSSRCHYCRNSALCLMAEKVFISWETLTLLLFFFSSFFILFSTDERSNEIAIKKWKWTKLWMLRNNN